MIARTSRYRALPQHLSHVTKTHLSARPHFSFKYNPYFSTSSWSSRKTCNGAAGGLRRRRDSPLPRLLRQSSRSRLVQPMHAHLFVLSVHPRKLHDLGRQENGLRDGCHVGKRRQLLGRLAAVL